MSNKTSSLRVIVSRIAAVTALLALVAVLIAAGTDAAIPVAARSAVQWSDVAHDMSMIGIANRINMVRLSRKMW